VTDEELLDKTANEEDKACLKGYFKSNNYKYILGRELYIKNKDLFTNLLSKKSEGTLDDKEKDQLICLRIYMINVRDFIKQNLGKANENKIYRCLRQSHSHEANSIPLSNTADQNLAEEVRMYKSVLEDNELCLLSYCNIRDQDCTDDNANTNDPTIIEKIIDAFDKNRPFNEQQYLEISGFCDSALELDSSYEEEDDDDDEY
jgi:hypothetical protein